MAEFYLQHHPKGRERRYVREVVDEYIASREENQRRHGKGDGKRWIDTLRSGLGTFGRRISTHIDSVTTADLENYFYGPFVKWSRRTLFNLDGMLRALFSFAQSQGYLPKGETAIDRLPKARKPHSDPEVLKPDELRRILETLKAKNPDLIPFVVIGAFAGVRAAEITRLKWEEHVDPKNGLIRLPSSVTKTNRRRVAEIKPVLAEWLADFADRKGSVVPFSNPHRSLATALKGAKVQRPHNGLRHSFASYELALTRNAPATALGLGNSVSMLETNYKQLVTPSDAKRWFEVTPTVVKSGWLNEESNAQTETEIEGTAAA
jgi:integrase